jgi:hypothetical protein
MPSRQPSRPKDWTCKVEPAIDQPESGGGYRFGRPPAQLAREEDEHDRDHEGPEQDVGGTTVQMNGGGPQNSRLART